VVEVIVMAVVPLSSKRQLISSIRPFKGPFGPLDTTMLAERALVPRVTQFSTRIDSGGDVASRWGA